MNRSRRGGDAVDRRLRAASPSLSSGGLRVARFINEHRALTLASSAAQLAAHTGTSDATVVRTVQALGFDGLPALRLALVEALDHASTPADDMRRTLADVGDDAARAIESAFEAHREAIDALNSETVRSKMVNAVRTLHAAQRIAIFAIGPSAHLGHYAAMLLNRNGRQAYCLDAGGRALADQLLSLTHGDAVIALAYGKAYPEIRALFAQSAALQLPVVLITDSLERRLSEQAHVVVPAKRGRTNRVALHGATLVTLEAIILGLATSESQRSLDALARLNELRAAVSETTSSAPAKHQASRRSP